MRDALASPGCARYSRERRPRDVVAQVALLLRQRAASCSCVERAHRRAFAEDLGRHALADVALRAAVDEQRLGGPGQHVDEAGRDGQAASRRPRSRPRAPREVADRGDAVAADADVGPTRRAARAVVDGAAADDHVEGARARGCGSQRGPRTNASRAASRAGIESRSSVGRSLGRGTILARAGRRGCCCPRRVAPVVDLDQRPA